MLTAALVIYGAGVIVFLLLAAKCCGDPKTFKELAGMFLLCLFWLPILFAGGAVEHYSKATKRTEEM